MEIAQNDEKVNCGGRYNEPGLFTSNIQKCSAAAVFCPYEANSGWWESLLGKEG